MSWNESREATSYWLSLRREAWLSSGAHLEPQSSAFSPSSRCW